MDSAAAGRCHGLCWCLLGGMVCHPLACCYCWLTTNSVQGRFHAAADEFARQTGLEIAIFKYASYVCEPEFGPRPHLLSEGTKVSGRGTWVFQILAGGPERMER